MKNAFLSRLRPLLAATSLGLAGLSAQAALVSYTGQVDSGPLAGSTFSGSFAYADPTTGFDGPVLLDSFVLNFDGLSYTLATADMAPVAWFAAGSFLGVDYMDLDSPGPAVQLLAGFFDLSEALFSYDVGGAAGQGFGGFTGFASVPEPGTIGLALVGLAALRRRKHGAKPWATRLTT